jgi:hypothetical protein
MQRSGCRTNAGNTVTHLENSLLLKPVSAAMFSSLSPVSLRFKQAVLLTTYEKNFVLNSMEKVAYLNAKLAEGTYSSCQKPKSLSLCLSLSIGRHLLDV